MSKNITIEVNGIPTAYTNKSVLEIPLTDGTGNARFQDVDEFDGSALETQVVSCDATIGNNGGMKFSYTPGERAMYVGVPDRDPSSAAGSLVSERFAHAVMVKVFADNTANVAVINNFGSGMNMTATLDNSTVTIPGTASCWLTNSEVKYTFNKIPV